MFFMDLFGKMELNSYLCRAKKERDVLRATSGSWYGIMTQFS